MDDLLENRIITADDLTASPDIIRFAFYVMYPNGLPLYEMLEHERGFIRTAAIHYMEAHQ